LSPAGQVIAPQNLQLVSNVAPLGALTIDFSGASPALSGKFTMTFTNPFAFKMNV
jgi:hypothetical protein